MAVCGVLQAAPALSKDVYQFRERGAARRFRLAENEVFFRDSRSTGSMRSLRTPLGRSRRSSDAVLKALDRSDVWLVIYEQGAGNEQEARRFISSSLVVKLSGAWRPETFAQILDLRLVRELPDRTFHFDAGTSVKALKAYELIVQARGIEAVEFVTAKPLHLRAAPNDPLFPDQWYLDNTGQESGATPGVDINAQLAWDAGFTGSGIAIGIADEGLDYSHEDLAPHYDSLLSYDFIDDDSDPAPATSNELHSTSVAGFAAAVGNNSMGATGVAYDATIVGMRLVVGFNPVLDTQVEASFLHETNSIPIKNNSWGPSDDGRTLEGPGALSQAALTESIMNGRGGLGTLYVWAGGNGHQNGDNANYDGFANSIYTISVAGVRGDGSRSEFSEEGAVHVVAAPAGSASGPKLISTDYSGGPGYGGLPDNNYTANFFGTSASAPMVSGVVALMLEANANAALNNLSWRDVQEILIATATNNDSSDSDWWTNGGDYHFNHKYGAGLVNAYGAVNAASVWAPLPAQQSVSQTHSGEGYPVSIPDNDSDGITESFNLSGETQLRVEHVTVTMTATHARRGDLEVTLISPFGTQSILAEQHNDTGDDYAGWTFMSTHNWGEDSSFDDGVWSVKVADRRNNNQGTLDDITLTVYGSAFETAPVAVADTAYVVDEGASFDANDADGSANADDSDDGVLANDTGSGALTSILIDPPSHHVGTFTLAADGTFSYVHDAGEESTDSFTYIVSDGTLQSAPRVVTIAINGINDIPVGVADSINVDEGATATTLVEGPGNSSVLDNDVDAEGVSMTATKISDPVNASSFTFNSDGTFSYTHDGSETTSDSFSYRASDGEDTTEIITVSIAINPVNDIPVGGLETISLSEGGTTSTLDGGETSVLANDTDGENESLTAIVDTAPSHASSFNLASNGTFTYTHDGGETTTDSFVYTAYDGTDESDPITVNISIAAINDPPIGVADTVALNEGGSATTLVEGPGNASVLDNDVDAEGLSMTASLVSGPTNESSFTFNPDGTFSYTHDGSETTSDGFSYQATDGEFSTGTVNVSIIVTPENDIPMGVAESISLDEGATATTLDGGETNVLANDSDGEGQSLTAVVESSPAHATSFTLNSDGTFSYEHDGGETTSDSFSYRADDGTDQSDPVTVTISIAAINDAPVGVADTIQLDEGATATVLVEGSGNTSVLDNDSDAEGTSLTASIVSNPDNAASFTFNSDGTFSYEHDGGETTSDEFTYQASDGEKDTGTVTVSITINPINDVPVGAAESISLAEGANATMLVGGESSVLANDTDGEDEPLTAVLVTPPAYDADFASNFQSDGAFSYQHDGSETTSDSFTYRADDGTDQSDIVTVSITIITSNDQPTVSTIDDLIWAEDEATTEIDLTVYFDDEESSPSGLTYTIESNSTPGLFAALPVVDGVISFTLATGQTGTSTLTVRGTDPGSLFGEATFDITVDTLLAWREDKFDPADLADAGKESTVWGDDADPDGDGRSNLMEFALGFEPLTSDFSEDRLSNSLVGDQQRITFYQRVNDSLLTFSPEVSADNVNWEDATDPGPPISQVGSPAVIDAAFEQVIWEDQTSVAPGSPRFIRLRVNR